MGTASYTGGASAQAERPASSEQLYEKVTAKGITKHEAYAAFFAMRPVFYFKL